MTTFLRKLCFEDLWLKLFALLVAVWIYVAVRQTQDSEAERVFEDLPVLVLGTAGQVGDLKVSPDRVNVKVRAEPQALGRLLPRDIHPVVDLTQPGALSQRHHRIVISAPPGVSASSVRPATAEVFLRPASSH